MTNCHSCFRLPSISGPPPCRPQRGTSTHSTSRLRHTPRGCSPGTSHALGCRPAAACRARLLTPHPSLMLSPVSSDSLGHRRPARARIGGRRAHQAHAPCTPCEAPTRAPPHCFADGVASGSSALMLSPVPPPAAMQSGAGMRLFSPPAPARYRYHPNAGEVFPAHPRSPAWVTQFRNRRLRSPNRALAHPLE